MRLSSPVLGRGREPTNSRRCGHVRKLPTARGFGRRTERHGENFTVGCRPATLSLPPSTRREQRLCARRLQMDKVCQACEHPEHSAIEEALGRGESYKTLTKQFKVSIGSMRRHRKHMGAEQVPVPAQDETGTGEPVYLRFGALPEGGRSYNYELDVEEDGASVFAARKIPGGYALDIPTEVEYARLIPDAVEVML